MTSARPFSIIKIEGLTKYYQNGMTQRTLAVDSLSLDVTSGEVFGFLGPNGAGKSTVIKIMMDFIRPDRGRITIKGLTVADPAVRRHVGYLPENPLFYDHLTAEELLRFAGKAAEMNPGSIRSRTEELLQRLDLSHAARRQIRTYSKGMTQRIGLALALVHDPEICILDEPMSGLDPLGRKLVADLIAELGRSGRTVFFSSHILSDIERLCDRVGVLHQGRLLFSGGISELTLGTEDLESAFIALIKRDAGETP